jgi:hypothetical protein
LDHYEGFGEPKTTEKLTESDRTCDNGVFYVMDRTCDNGIAATFWLMVAKLGLVEGLNRSLLMWLD